MIKQLLKNLSEEMKNKKKPKKAKRKKKKDIAEIIIKKTKAKKLHIFN